MGLEADVRGDDVLTSFSSSFDQREYDYIMTTEEELKQQLLIKLRSLLQFDAGSEGQFPALRELRSYDDFFDRSFSCPPEASRRTQARFSALKRHGNCRTRRAVIVRPEKFDHACELTPDEWENLLEPLLHNPNLEELYILACTSIDSSEVKDKIYTILGEVLRTSKTLKFMFLEMGGLYAANVARLVQGLQGNRESSLEASIIIERPQGDAMHYVCEMIRSAPKLRHLWLKRIGAVDDVAVKDWSQALRQSATLVKLTLEGLKIEGISELLTKAFSETVSCPNQSVKELELIEVDGGTSGWKQFFDFLRPNTILTCLELSDCSFQDTDEVFRNLMEMLQFNFTLTKFENGSISSWKKDGKETAINELLERNGTHEQQFSVTYGT